MNEEETVNGLNGIPQVKSNNIPIKNTNTIPPRILTKLRLTIYQQEKLILNEWCYVLEY